MIKSFKKYQFTLCFLLTLVFVLSWPFVLSATTTGLVVCGTGEDGKPTDCDFTKLVELIRGVIDFFFLNIIVPIGVIVIVYAGGRLVYYSSFMSNPGESKNAKRILTNVILGMALAFGAYLIVKSLLGLLPAREGGVLPQAIEQVF